MVRIFQRHYIVGTRESVFFITAYKILLYDLYVGG